MSGVRNCSRTAEPPPPTPPRWGGESGSAPFNSQGSGGPGLVGDVGEPGAGLALRFGDLAGGHVLGDVGPAFLGEAVALEGGKVEPFVRFDHVDGDAAAAGRISDAELVERLDV